MVEKLVTAHEHNRRIVAILDIETAASSPEHLVVRTEQVSPIARGHGECAAANRQANPDAARDGNQAHIVDFLVTRTDAEKEKRHDQGGHQGNDDAVHVTLYRVGAVGVGRK